MSLLIRDAVEDVKCLLERIDLFLAHLSALLEAQPFLDAIRLQLIEIFLSCCQFSLCSFQILRGRSKVTFLCRDLRKSSGKYFNYDEFNKSNLIDIVICCIRKHRKTYRMKGFTTCRPIFTFSTRFVSLSTALSSMSVSYLPKDSSEFPDIVAPDLRATSRRYF